MLAFVVVAATVALLLPVVVAASEVWVGTLLSVLEAAAGLESMVVELAAAALEEPPPPLPGEQPVRQLQPFSTLSLQVQ